MRRINAAFRREAHTPWVFRKIGGSLVERIESGAFEAEQERLAEAKAKEWLRAGSAPEEINEYEAAALAAELDSEADEIR